METTINLIIFIVLLVLTAFFVATEFAIVKVRQTRLDQLTEEGKPGANSAQKVVSQLDEYLSACQLGITITALGIGMVGESTFEFFLHPLFSSIGIPENFIHIFTIAGAFIIATFLHVVVGELAPKTIAIQKAEAITLAFSKPIIFFYKVLYPFIFILNGSARLILKVFGFKPASEHDMTHTEEELKLLLSESYQSGEINSDELTTINNVFEFDNTIARDVMVPRRDMVGFEKDTPIKEVLERVNEERFTRYPIYEQERDNIIGFIHIRDFVKYSLDDYSINDKTLSEFLYPVIRSIETVSLSQLLQDIKRHQVHMVILMDEFGGTSGLITMEDILEEIVGDIKDEYDADEPDKLIVLNEDHQHYHIHSSTALSKVERLLDIDFGDTNFESIGGWFSDFQQEQVQFKDIDFQIATRINENDYMIETIQVKDDSNIEES